VLTRLIEHTGESPTLDWMAIDDLAGLWAADSLDVRAPSVDSCEGGIAEAAAMPAFTKAVITHLEAGRPDEARARLDRAESTWPCLDGAAARPDLQLIALLRAWLEFEVSNAEAFEDAIRQAVAFSPTLPGALEPTLPAEVQETFATYAAESSSWPTWDLQIATRGDEAEVLVDGLPIPTTATGGTGRAGAVALLPGHHLLQVIRDDGVPEAAVLLLDRRGGTVRAEVVTTVPITEVRGAFLRSVTGHQPDPRLQALLAEHPRSRPHARVVLAAADPTDGRPVITPLRRRAPGRYEVDERLAGALSGALDRATRDASLTEPEEPRGPPGTWGLRAGASVGMTRVQGFTYLAPSVELAVDTPIWIAAMLRGGVRIHPGEHVHTQGAGRLSVAFTPRVKRLGLAVGVGGEIRGPDHRFEGAGVLPVVEVGVGVRIGARLYLALRGDVVLHPVHDLGLHVGLTRRFGGKKGGSAGAADGGVTR